MPVGDLISTVTFEQTCKSLGTPGLAVFTDFDDADDVAVIAPALTAYWEFTATWQSSDNGSATVNIAPTPHGTNLSSAIFGGNPEWALGILSRAPGETSYIWGRHGWDNVTVVPPSGEVFTTYEVVINYYAEEEPCDPPATPELTGAISCGGRRHTLTWAAVEGADSYELAHGATLIYSGTDLTASYTLTRAELPFSQEYTLTAINDCGESEDGVTVGPMYTSADSCDTTFTAADSCDTDYSAPLCDEV
jgi:hypothetical protein